MLIHVKMPTTVGILTFMNKINFVLSNLKCNLICLLKVGVLRFGGVCVCVCGGGGGTLIFSYIRKLGTYFGVQNFEFQNLFWFSGK